MSQIDFPFKKDYEYPIETPKGGLMLIYPQATMWEQIQFLRMDVKQMSIWINDFLITYGKLDKPFWRRKTEIYDAVLYEANAIIDKIMKTRYQGWQDEKKGNNDSGGRSMIFSAVLNIVCKEYCVELDSLLNNYTYEQFEWMLDGIEFNANEQTDEGQRKNDRRFLEKSEKSNEELLKELGVNPDSGQRFSNDNPDE